MAYRNKNITKRISSVKYSIFSPKDILKQSVVKVITPEIYDKYGFPVEGGLMDIRMGVIEPGLRCKTCGNNYKDCEGHFGHLELARPILNVLFIDPILRTLQSTCRECFRVLYPEEKIADAKQYLDDARGSMSSEKFAKFYTKFMANLNKVKTCPHCEAKQEGVKLDKSSVFVFSEGEKKRLLTTEIRFRFENILDSDLPLLNLVGLRPEWLLLTALSIPPVSMRSTITLQSGQRSEDDLTHKLTDIIRTNQRLHEHLLVGVPEAIIEDVWDLLQYHISTYMDNTITGLPPARHRNGDSLKSIAERIKGKKGLIRNNLIGKRVNYSARTVISPDPKLNLNEVGVPVEIARKLTVPESVTAENIDFLKSLVANGPLVYPGASYLRTNTGSKKKISTDIVELLLDEIEPGYIIERHLLDGDSVIFNRQPSLHKLSMMGLVVKVLPIKTFAINPGICKPFNADFDGDEMNLHAAQTLEARQEVERIMDVKHQLISPASGDAVIGCIQDSITGLYVMTKDTEYSREDALELLFSIGFREINRIKFGKKVTGREVFSVILPEGVNFIGESKSGQVIIKNSKLVEGVIDKKTIGDGGGTLLRHLHKNYGPDEVLRTVRYMFNLGIQVLAKKGFTISMGDFDVPKKLDDDIERINNEVYAKIDGLIEEFKTDKLERITGMTLKQTLEIKILQLLNSIRDDAMKIVKEDLDKNTGTMLMADSGAMGKVMSIVQMHTGLGQQALRGQRISRGYKERTLSCFKKGDIGPEARGYIKSALRKGLKPYEVFIGNITGRDGLMDTALRTPKTGYLYRRMATAMLDLIVSTDLSVRNEDGVVVQFKYGDDGIDVAKTVSGAFDVKGIIENTLGGKK
ncbi:MAG: DNA-directed RNA polymerase subunit A' [Candidatus Woesearchaeota archaeon]|jgi:DNA-directed RNA polymerase subunit A'|nr:DNA-directed RNA polymerase subunit A' [Candidatus Woesearchaeota archaeon]